MFSLITLIVVTNPCSRNPCKNGGKCSSGFDGQQYQCECLEGYRGTNCEGRGKDIKENGLVYHWYENVT